MKDEGPPEGAEVVQVECYSGHTYAQEPRAVIWQGQRFPVAEVEERWRTPEGPAFRVRLEPEGVLALQYHELQARWTIGDPAGLT